MKKDLLNRTFIILLFLYFISIVINISAQKNKYQWDFNGFYQCTKAYENGINPYDTHAVSAMAKEPILAYVYPPITLLFFRIFTKMDYAIAFQVFLVLKCILILATIALWRNSFFDKQVDAIFYFLCLLGFNSAIYLDLRAGNISILEQFLIWLAIACYVKRRYTCFCALVIIAAVFKIQPIAFLLLLLFVVDKDKYKYLLGSFTAFGMVFLAQFIFSPHLFIDFIANATHSLTEGGIINPSTFTFIRKLVGVSTGLTDIALLTKISIIFYLITASMIVFISWVALRRLQNTKMHDGEKWIIFMACLIYTLVCIRFKDYSFILLIPPAYYLIKRIASIKTHIVLFIAVSLTAVHVTLPGLKTVFYLLWNYYPLMITYCLWILYVWGFHSSDKKPVL